TILPLGDQRDDRMRRVGIELGAVRAVEAGDVPRELDDGELHAEAYAEIRNPVFARVADRLDLAFDAALAESARNENGVHRGETVGPLALDDLGVDVMDIHAAPRVNPGVRERLG